MPYTYFGERAGARILCYGVGRRQLQRDGTYAAYDAYVETWGNYPSGHAGKSVFRSIDLTMRHKAGYNITVNVTVDRVNVAQQSFSGGPPPRGNTEEEVDMRVPFKKKGKRIVATVTIDSQYGETEIINMSASGKALRLVG